MDCKTFTSRAEGTAFTEMVFFLLFYIYLYILYTFLVLTAKLLLGTVYLGTHTSVNTDDTDKVKSSELQMRISTLELIGKK